MSKYCLSCLNLSCALRHAIFIFLLAIKFQFQKKMCFHYWVIVTCLFYHISNNNGYFTFNVDFVFPLLLPRLSLDGIYEWHCWCLIRSRNCLPFVRTWLHAGFSFGGVRVAHLFSLFLFFCRVFCFVCLQPVSFECGMSILHCPFCFF